VLETIVKFSSLAMPLILLCSLYVTFLLYRFTRAQARLETLKLLDSRWQEINRSMIERPELQRLLGDPRLSQKTDEEIRTYNLLFQILNICHEVWFALRDGLIDRSMGESFLAGNIALLRARREEVKLILADGRGYDPRFIAHVLGALERSASVSVS
jgi:hypothetical protein